MHRPSLIVLTAILLAGASLPAFADDVETVVVSATRTEQPQARTGESVSVLDSASLRNLQTVSLTDALVLTPGIVVDQNGGIGQPSAVSIRGADTGQTLVLIDGVRINDPSGTDDGAILSDVLVNNIDRVEILRGPQSTLYGSDAIGGVIDIFSKRGGDSPFGLTASAEGGSEDTYHLNAAANGTSGPVDYGAAANFMHSNGISAADKRNGNPETDGYRNLGLTGNVRVHFSDAISLDLRSYYTDAKTDFDDNSLFFPPFLTRDSAAYNTNKFFAGYAGLNADLFGGKFHNRLAAMHSGSDREFFDSFFDFGVHMRDAQDKGKATRLEYQGSIDISPDDQLVFGAEDERTSFANAGTFSSDRGHATIYSFYGQYQKTLFDILTLTGGIRTDHHSRFGSHTSLKFAGAWQLTGTTTLHANYGDGFKAPSLYQLFSQYGQDTLAPEKARGWETGLAQMFLDGRARASVTYFQRRTTNLIDFVTPDCAPTPPATPPAICATRPFGYYANVGRARVRGFEVEVGGKITGTLSLTASYTNLDASNPDTGLQLNRRPRNTASATLTWAPSNWSLGASLDYVGKQIDQYDTSTVPATAFTNGSHTLANLFGQYSFGQWSLYGRVGNVFAEHYEPLIGYGAPGRTVFAGVRVAQ
ncbi:MAG: TonB-dependent receptor [Proteobacteria bacterium]|nr:TonB-dependent receptor [Pseudomonadota bacterium]